jgi:hypothetical protein
MEYARYPHLLILQINIVKISILPKATYRFSVIFIKTQITFSWKYKNNSKIHMEEQQKTLKLPKKFRTERNKVVGIISPVFEIYYKAIVTKNSIVLA